MTCFICDKHKGKLHQPPGGYIYEDSYWRICHFPADQAVLGQLVVESKRHFLDFSEMTDEEATSYGLLTKRIYAILKQATNAERVYSLVTIDGVPHFHAHFIPRSISSLANGATFIIEEKSCDSNDASEFATKIRPMFLE